MPSSEGQRVIHAASHSHAAEIRTVTAMPCRPSDQACRSVGRNRPKAAESVSTKWTFAVSDGDAQVRAGCEACRVAQQECCAAQRTQVRASSERRSRAQRCACGSLCTALGQGHCFIPTRDSPAPRPPHAFPRRASRRHARGACSPCAGSCRESRRRRDWSCP
jgi:hypothetical protein